MQDFRVVANALVHNTTQEFTSHNDIFSRTAEEASGIYSDIKNNTIASEGDIESNSLEDFARILKESLFEFSELAKDFGSMVKEIVKEVEEKGSVERFDTSIEHFKECGYTSLYLAKNFENLKDDAKRLEGKFSRLEKGKKTIQERITS